MKLIVGLGNPGKRYRGTRHNVGSEVIERLAASKGVRLKRKWRLKASVGKLKLGNSEVALAVPRTYMNLSGETVAALARLMNCAPADILVVSDDINLALGRIRIRRRGGAGGHRGLESVAARLGSEDFARLRVGVGPAAGDRTEHVLGRFGRGERKAVEEACARAACAAEEIVANGLEPAMNRYNSPDGV